MKADHLMYSFDTLICAAAQALTTDVAMPAQKWRDQKFVSDKTYGDLFA